MFAMYLCTMHNRIFMQFCAAWVECLALSLFINLSYFCLVAAAGRRAFSLILMCAVACFPYLVMVSELLWKYSEYTCSLQAAKTSDYKSMCTCSQLDHMIHIYIYIREIPPFSSLVWGEREQAPIIYTFCVEFWLLITIKYLRNTLSKQYNKCVDKYYSTCSAE